MRPGSPRLAVRALLVQDDALLLVNAFPGGHGDLWVAPGGGVEAGASLAENLMREVEEETGLIIAPGPLCHIAEFHNPDTGFHQVELYFRAELVSGGLTEGWRDPEGIVTHRRFVPRNALAAIRLSPPELPGIAFGPRGTIIPGDLARMLSP